MESIMRTSRSRATLRVAADSSGARKAAGSICAPTRKATPFDPAASDASTPKATAMIASPAYEPAQEAWTRRRAGLAHTARKGPRRPERLAMGARLTYNDRRAESAPDGMTLVNER